ncbi:hypothetical protein [Nostoc favosum]|nr:hypothetical protein [Nostoc favosum]
MADTNSLFLVGDWECHPKGFVVTHIFVTVMSRSPDIPPRT